RTAATGEPATAAPARISTVPEVVSKMRSGVGVDEDPPPASVCRTDSHTACAIAITSNQYIWSWLESTSASRTRTIAGVTTIGRRSASELTVPAGGDNPGNPVGSSDRRSRLTSAGGEVTAAADTRRGSVAGADGASVAARGDAVDASALSEPGAEPAGASAC